MTNDKIYSLWKETSKKQLPCNSKHKSKIELGNHFPFRAGHNCKEISFTATYVANVCERILTCYYDDKGHK